MTYIEELHVGDIGTIIKVLVQDIDSSGGTSALDVSDATVKIIFRKPDGTSVEKTASYTTDGTDGYIQYVTQTGDLDVQGTWNIQAQIVTLSGSWKSNVKTFKVYPNI